MPGSGRFWDDGGFIAVEWAAGTALLVVPVLLLAMLLPSWSARHEAAAAAAREAARVAARADTPEQAEQEARRAATAVLATRGYTTDGTQVEVLVTADGVADGHHLPRRGAVEVHVRLPTPGIDLPGLGRVAGPVVQGSHIRLLDPLRER